jgi:hypothetical protein
MRGAPPKCCVLFFFHLFNRSMSLSDTYFCDAEGNHFMVKDIAALGDCAVLALVASFAQGPGETGYSRVYSLLRSMNAEPFQAYIQQVLQPRFWVRTEFFVWISMLYGVEVKVHFFGADKIPTVQSTCSFFATSFS